MRRNNLVGQCFNRLTVVGAARLCTKKNVVWDCVCVCGGHAEAYAYDLKSGRVKSCGCLVKEGLRSTHGMSHTPTYAVWASMLQRCFNKKDASYPWYGARGITVCKRWHIFAAFLADMGAKPAGLSLERRDNNKGYSPANCFWATRKEQARNKRNTIRVCVAGRVMVLTDALQYVGYSGAALHYQRNAHALTHQEVFDKWLQKKTA